MHITTLKYNPTLVYNTLVPEWGREDQTGRSHGNMFCPPNGVELSTQNRKRASGSAWSEFLPWVQGVVGSNPASPTINFLTNT